MAVGTATFTVPLSGSNAPQPVAIAPSPSIPGAGTIVAIALSNITPYTGGVLGCSPSPDTPQWLEPGTTQIFTADATSSAISIGQWQSPLGTTAPSGTPYINATYATQSLDELSNVPTGALGISVTNFGPDATVDIGEIEGNVYVENAAGTYLETADIPSVPIGFTGGGSGTVVTDTALPPGLGYLVIANNDTGTPSCVNVYGLTSGTRYAWNAVIGQYAPLVIPVDPATDSLYVINEADTLGLGIHIASIRAYAAEPVLPQPALQFAGGSAATFVAGDSFGVLPNLGQNACVMLRQLHWIGIHNNTNAGLDNAEILLGEALFPGAAFGVSVINMWSAQGPSSTGYNTIEETVDFPDPGMPLACINASTLVISVLSQSGTFAIARVTAAYNTL